MYKEREPFVQAAKRTPVDLQEWAVSLMEKDNRKSHLAPQLSPGTQDLLRTSDSPVGQHSNSPDYALPTPTSGDIPIAGGDVRFPATSSHYSDQATARSPTKNGSGSIGRAAGSAYHSQRGDWR